MIDLENFPTSTTALKMLQEVSPIYDNSYVAKWIYQVIGLEIDEARKYIEELRLQAFPETATWGIVYWEQRYHIAPDESLSLDDRRKRIISRRGKRAPMNPARLEFFLQDVTGRSVVVTEQKGQYVFFVTILDGDSAVDYHEVNQIIKAVKPSHLSFQIYIEADITLTIKTGNESWKFDYAIAGTVPDTNTLGNLQDEKLILNTDIEDYKFDYAIAGTSNAGEKPVVNTAGALQVDNLILKPGVEGHSFNYALSGTKNAGEVPDINTVGDIESGSILPDIETSSTNFDYQLCGDDTET